MNKLPLRIFLLAHPQSSTANEIALNLLQRFVEPLGTGNLRIPVFLTPNNIENLPPEIGSKKFINLENAEHNLIVLLIDSKMLQQVNDGTGKKWKEFIDELLKLAPIGSSPHYILPVALDSKALENSGEYNWLRCFRRENLNKDEADQIRIEELTFYTGSRAIQLLKDKCIKTSQLDNVDAPITVFYSHAKADLDHVSFDDPINKTVDFINRKKWPIKPWFDAQNITAGQSFEKAIQAGERDSTIILSFLTDHYSSRPWCRREILNAKQYGAHLIVIDALTKGEVRSFPYSGNVPVVRWEYSNIPDLDARRVIDRAILEALRNTYNRALLEPQQKDANFILATAPEAVNLAFNYDEEKNHRTFLYPDPPLGAEELFVLNKLRPQAIFETPLTRIAKKSGSKNRPNQKPILISISESDDIDKYGLSIHQFKNIFDEICLFLFVAGYKVAYGGVLSGIKTNNNFTQKLLDNARTYFDLAQDFGNSVSDGSILNIVPWPLWLNYEDEEEWSAFFCKTGDCYKVPAPDGFENIFIKEDMVNKAQYNLALTSAVKKYAWSFAMTKMRKTSIDLTKARIVIGGRLEGYSGLVSGMLEETYLSIKSKQPVYIIGGFGGVAGLISDLLLQIDRQEVSNSWVKEHILFYDETIAKYKETNTEFISSQEMANFIKESGKLGLDKVLNNGLTHDENLFLLSAQQSNSIISLIYKGLKEIGDK